MKRKKSMTSRLCAVLATLALVPLTLAGCNSNGTTNGVVNLDSIHIVGGDFSMPVGDVDYLALVFTPLDASNQNVIWASSNRGVATVDSSDGFVEALHPGTAVITATPMGNPSAAERITVTVTQGGGVLPPPPPPPPGGDDGLRLDFRFGAGQIPGWTAITTGDGNTTNATHALGYLELLGATRGTRWDPSRAQAPYTGCIQPNGAGTWGRIQGLTGAVTVTVTYTSTGTSACDRTTTIRIGGTSYTGPGATGAANLRTVTFTGTGPIEFEGSGALRIYRVQVTGN